MQAAAWLGVAVELLRPWPLKLILDNLIGDRPWPPPLRWLTALPGGGDPGLLVIGLALSTLLIHAVREVLRLLEETTRAGLSRRIDYDLGGELFDQLQRRPPLRASAQGTGDLLKRITSDCRCISELLFAVLLPMLTAVVQLGLTVAVLGRLDLPLTAVLLLLIPADLLLIRRGSAALDRATSRHEACEADRYSLAEQLLPQVPLVQAFDRQAWEGLRFAALGRDSLEAYRRLNRVWALFGLGVAGLSGFGTAAVLLIGGLRVQSGALTLGTLLVFLGYLRSLLDPLEALAYGSSGHAGALARAARVFELLGEERPLPVLPPLRHLPRGQACGALRFEAVCFTHRAGCSTLADIDLTIAAGERVALVGASGAGKSTLMALIPRFIDPDGGRVLLDGVDLRSLPLQELRSQVALVPQDPQLLPLTIAETIAYGRPDASAEEIRAAARAAQAEAFIERLPAGYDSVIGEAGTTLSGGERQRLAIARALLRQAPILLLDDPTSALDPSTEAALIAALESVSRGRTCLTIAHRLETVLASDRIVLLERGRIVACAPPAVLAADPRSALHQLLGPAPANQRGLG